MRNLIHCPSHHYQFLLLLSSLLSVIIKQHLFIVVAAWHVGSIEDLLLLIELGETFLRLEVLVEGDQLVADLLNHLHLLQQHLVQVGHVLLHVRPRLVHLVQQHHFLLHQINHVINVPSVAINELFLFLKDLINKPFMLIA